jgi:hypothetical protein
MLIEGGEYFRSHEFGGSAERVCGTSESHLLLAETVIGNLDVSVEGKQDVVQLQISIDNLVLM